MSIYKMKRLMQFIRDLFTGRAYRVWEHNLQEHEYWCGLGKGVGNVAAESYRKGFAENNSNQ